MKAEISESKIEVTIALKITENQARALDEFSRYGEYKDSIDFITKHWHTDIKIDHLKSFFECVHNELGPHISKIDQARKIFDVVKPSS